MSDARTHSDAGIGQGAPGRAPARFHEAQSADREKTKPGEDEETRRIRTSAALGHAQRTGEIESTDTATAADESGHHADIFAEPLREKLEDRAIGHAERR